MLTKMVFFAPLIIVCMMSTACSQWPGPEHRQVTLAGISELLEEQCQSAAVQTQLTDIHTQLGLQQKNFVTLSEEVNRRPSPIVIRDVTPKVSKCEPRKSQSLVLDNKIIVGANEWIYINPPGKHFTARIDTGAATSSISARNIVRFERNGKRWVAFDLDTGEDGDAVIHIEAPLKRNVRIRQASYEDIDRRPVIELDVGLGYDINQPTEFTLADRRRMSFPVLLGRSFLRDLMLVDVGSEFLHAKVNNDEVDKP